jgi:hypothetical protein
VVERRAGLRCVCIPIWYLPTCYLIHLVSPPLQKAQIMEGIAGLMSNDRIMHPCEFILTVPWQRTHVYNSSPTSYFQPNPQLRLVLLPHHNTRSPSCVQSKRKPIASKHCTPHSPTPSNAAAGSPSHVHQPSLTRSPLAVQLPLARPRAPSKSSRHSSTLSQRQTQTPVRLHTTRLHGHRSEKEL